MLSDTNAREYIPPYNILWYNLRLSRKLHIILRTFLHPNINQFKDLREIFLGKYINYSLTMLVIRLYTEGNLFNSKSIIFRRYVIQFQYWYDKLRNKPVLIHTYQNVYTQQTFYYICTK